MMQDMIKWRLLIALTVIVGLLPAMAAASHGEDTRQLALAHDFPNLEATFRARQQDFQRGRILPSYFQIPYSVFKSTDPDIQAATAAWLVAYPGSGYAMAARGLALVHLGLLYRGNSFRSETSRRAFSKMHELLGEAIPLLSAALELDPSNLAAAYGLVSAGGSTGNREARDKGLSVVEKWAEPDDAVLSGLRYTYPRWGGLPQATKIYCAARTGGTGRLTREQCLAIADYDQGVNIDQALKVLAAGSVDLLVKYHIEKLLRGDRIEEARKLAEAQGYMTLRLAYELRRGLDDVAPLERFVTDQLKRDPLNPELLSALADVRWASFDQAGAREALDKAMVYGLYWPRLRLSRMHAAPPAEAFSEIVGALDATDYDFEVLTVAAELVMLSSTVLGEDAIRPPDFECQRLRILERHVAACKAGASHGSCDNTFRRDTIIADARQANACGTDSKRKWQDYVRDFLDLNE